ncbi:MAG: phosphoribosylglycinamide formyltransferase [Rhodospirillales bacterium]|nr:phosphoribosylglycinamide formyltransferase [Rhodospirillales bacterium]
MSDKLKVGVLISGRGSNLQALLDACTAPDFPAEVVLVLSNKAGAYGLERAAKAGIATQVINHKDFPSRIAFDDAMHEVLVAAGAEFICLAGFMRLLSVPFVDRWTDRLVNIHPSLLPAFKGLDVHQRVLDAGVRFTGCTVHIVRAELDDGPIIVQAVVPVRADDDTHTLAARVLNAEHRCYPLALKLVAEGRVRIDGMRVHVDGAVAPDGALVNPAIG